MRLILTACGLALVLAACASRREAPPLPSSHDTYKQTVARDVLQHQPGAYCEPGSEMLKSVVILEIAIGGDGALLGVSVVRSNGHPFTPPGEGVQFLESFLFREDECFLIRSLVP
jgi:hypothetical protein